MLTTFCGLDPEGGKEMKRRRSRTLLLLLLPLSGLVEFPASLLLLLLLLNVVVSPASLLMLLLLLLGVVNKSGWSVSSSALCCQNDTMLSGVTTVPLWPLQ
jgi:hypothetical protein